MINRVLIRIKVVQLLYSYLLTRSELKLPKEPESNSRDNVFAFLMYHDILSFLVSLAGIDKGVSKGGEAEGRILAHNKFLISLMANDDVRLSLQANSKEMEKLMATRAEIFNRVVSAPFYKTYLRKRSRGIEDEVALLKNIVNEILAKSVEFERAVRSMDGYTGAGFAKGFEAVNDTLDSFLASCTGLTEARNSLTGSLDKAYELYNSLLYLIVELTRLQDQKIDAAKHKHLATVEDLNPNMRFVENRLAKLLVEDEQFMGFVKDNSISWVVNNPELAKRLLDMVVSSDIYAEYMAMPETDLHKDCEFWKNVLKKIIFPSDDLAEALENMSVYWNDDLGIMDSFVVKTIKKIANDGKVTILPKYKDEEDAKFGAELFNIAVDKREEYRELIDRFIDRNQWDSERLAFMDIVIMITAIAEILNYPAIPIAVTLNEYIEIANSYSTPRSGSFVHGILTSVINLLKSEGKLLKN